MTIELQVLNTAYFAADCSVKEWSNPDVSCVPAKYYMGVQLAVSVLLVAVAAFTCISQ